MLNSKKEWTSFTGAFKTSQNEFQKFAKENFSKMEEIMLRNRSTIIDLKVSAQKHTDQIKELELNLETAKGHR
jgi:hypothetical protein